MAFKVYFCVLAGVLGAVMGSFLNCWAMRWETGERWPRGRSRCPKCGRTLGAAELVPLLSWLVQRGRCRGCGERISVRYPLTELTGALAFVLAAARFGLTAEAAQAMLLASVLMLLSLIDLDTMTLPDVLVASAAVIWALFLPAYPEWKSRLVSGLATGAVAALVLVLVAAVMTRVLGRDALGGGDVKLVFVLGLYLGPMRTIFGLLAGCAAALVFAWRAKVKSRPFPFGPALCFGGYVSLLYGQAVVDAYMELMMRLMGV